MLIYVLIHLYDLPIRKQGFSEKGRNNALHKKSLYFDNLFSLYFILILRYTSILNKS